jgi:hypothetical protein
MRPQTPARFARNALAALLLAGAVAAPASAATVTFLYNYEFSGAQSPAGPAPWMSATFDDFGGTGSVRVTIATSGLSGVESVMGAYFNLDPNLNPASLGFAYVSGQAATSVQTGVNAFQADGDGRYDIRFNYPDGGGFDAGETSVYTISGIASLTAASFNFFSSPAGGQGVYLAAAHVQNIGGIGQGSGWIAPIPVPAAGWLLGTGLLALLGAGLRRPRAA